MLSVAILNGTLRVKECGRDINFQSNKKPVTWINLRHENWHTNSCTEFCNILHKKADSLFEGISIVSKSHEGSHGDI